MTSLSDRKVPEALMEYTEDREEKHPTFLPGKHFLILFFWNYYSFVRSELLPFYPHCLSIII